MPKIIAALIIICSALQGNAQTSVGLNIGLNIANWSGTDPGNILQGNSSLSSLTGFLVSVPVESRQSAHLGFVQEAAWSQKGTGIDLDEVVNGIPVTAISRVVINNLEYGAYIKGIYPVGKTEAFAFAGPTIGMAIAGSLSVKTTESNGGEPVTVKEPINFEEWGYKRFEWGLGFGTGVSFLTGKSKFSLLLRYNLGLTDVDRGDGPNAKIRNRVLNFSVGYHFSYTDD